MLAQLIRDGPDVAGSIAACRGPGQAPVLQVGDGYPAKCGRPRLRLGASCGLRCLEVQYHCGCAATKAIDVAAEMTAGVTSD